MLLEVIIALLIGILFGTLTGLIPGIHINLIGVFLISLSTSFLIGINPIYLVVFMVSLAITHTFIDFIPSILLGCPDTSTELSILPGHDLLKKGQGHEAIILSTYGSLAAVVLIIIFAFPSLILFPKINSLVKDLIPFILILVSIFMISIEKNKKTAFLVFLITGILGWCVLNLETLNQPLLPLLTGLFGGSMLIQSIKNQTEIPEQKITKPLFNKNYLKPITASLISSPLCSFLPGLGAGQAAIIGKTLTRQKEDKKGFLILLGATNTLVMAFSFITLYLFSKTRTGAAAAIKSIFNSFSTNILILILIVILISGIISFFLTKELSKFSIKKIQNLNYKKISIITLGILLIITLLVSGIFGLIVLILSTLTGIYCINQNVKRTLMMGCLMVPVILLYFGI